MGCAVKSLVMSCRYFTFCVVKPFFFPLLPSPSLGSDKRSIGALLVAEGPT